jgi:hypothetical protein
MPSKASGSLGKKEDTNKKAQEQKSIHFLFLCMWAKEMRTQTQTKHQKLGMNP